MAKNLPNLVVQPILYGWVGSEKGDNKCQGVRGCVVARKIKNEHVAINLPLG